MQILFIYKNTSIQVTPIELRFCHKENEYGQLYLVVQHIGNPIHVEIPNLFKGVFVNSIIYETYVVMYFMNQCENINEIGYYDPWLNKLIYNKNSITHTDIKILKFNERIMRPQYEQITLTYTQENNYMNNPSKQENITPNNHIVMNIKLNAMLKNLRQYVFQMKNLNGYGNIHIQLQSLNSSVIKYIFHKLCICLIKIVIIPLNLIIKTGDYISIQNKLWQIVSVVHYITCTKKITTVVSTPKQNIQISITTKDSESNNIMIKNRKVIASPMIHKKIFDVLLV